MVFRDRVEAGQKLYEALTQDARVKTDFKSTVILSLVRGGVVVGDVLSQKLRCAHLPLAVVKISAPHQTELAIGALCFDISYLEPRVVKTIGINKAQIREQIAQAQTKFRRYVEVFKIEKKTYALTGKVAIIVDDGIATGASIKAAYLFVKSCRPQKVIIASPIAPTDFEIQGPDKIVILHKSPSFASVSQFYENFPQVTDEEVKRVLGS